MANSTVPMFDPSGQVRLIPADQAQAAAAAGGKPAVKMMDPSGTLRWIPQDQQDAALKAGGKLAAPPSTAQQGFLGSFSDASGLSSLGNAIAHPIDTVMGIPAAVKGVVSNTVDNVKQGVADYQKTGLSDTTRRDFGRAIPIVGPALATAQAQQDAGNTSGMLGTMAGTVAGLAAPEAMKGALPAVAPTIVKIAKGPLQGVSFVLDKAGRAAEFTGATTQTQKLMASRFIVDGTPGELLQRALKPSVTQGADASTMLQDTMPAILKANPNAATVGEYGQAADAARAAQGAQYDARIAPYRQLPNGAQGATPRPGMIDANPIANAQLRSIPVMDQIENPATSAPSSMKFINVSDGEGGTMRMGAQVGGDMRGGIVNKTGSVADNYRRPISVPVLDEVRQDANAKLNAFYNKASGDQNAALSNPETARVKAVGDTTRQLLYERLAKDAGIEPGDIAAEQQLYGKLANVSDIANKRDAVFSRQDPISLAEKVAQGHGGPVSRVTNYLAQKGLKSITDSDALVGSAVDRFQNPIETPANPSSNPIAGGISQAGTVTRKAAQAILKGQDKWAQMGMAKLSEHISRDSASTITAADADALIKTPKGKGILIQASDLNPGSAAMKNLVKQIPLALGQSRSQ